ncbi:MAG: ribosome maturation factor RimP [Acidimicrobiia bacterium]|nr:ribosome maturation factor RimP [Acidimicrobiia bacterium]
MSVIDRVSAIVDPIIDDMGLELYDIEQAGPIMRVSVWGRADRNVTVDQLARLTRALSSALDEADPISAGYTLEVTSPGLERKLRLPRHHRDAIGADVNLKLVPRVEPRRLSGTLVAADDDGITVRDADLVEHRFGYDDIQTARTIFEWGPTPRPGGSESRRTKGSRSKPQRGEKSSSAERSTG